MRYTFIIWSLLILPIFSFGQKLEKKDKRELKKAFMSIDYKDYIDARERFDALLIKYPNNSRVKFGNGITLLNEKNKEHLAIEYMRDIVPNAKMKNFYYFLGIAYRKNGEFDEAITCLQTFLFDPKRTIETEIVKHELDKCYFVEELSNTKRNVQILNLGPTINTSAQESVPVLLPNQDGMFFTSRSADNVSTSKDYQGNYYQDIFYSDKNSTTWSKPINTKHLNTKLHDASVSFNEATNKFYFFRTNPDNIASGDIFEADCDSNNLVSNPHKLNESINSQYIESSVTVSKNGRMLIFSSNRPGGYGGFDLYKANLLPTGQWGTPVNLGAIINTDKNEDAPFLHADGKTLYFSSDGHLGVGGFDIFKTTLSANKRWKKPNNIGLPINSIYHDMYYSVAADNRTAMYSSNKPGGYGDDDIYSVKLLDDDSYKTVVIGKVLFNGEKTNVVSKITIINPKDKELKGVYRTNENNGKFIMVVEPLEIYEFIVVTKGYETLFLNYSEEDLLDMENLVINLKTIKQ